jgi:hypothetical protein
MSRLLESQLSRRLAVLIAAAVGIAGGLGLYLAASSTGASQLNARVRVAHTRAVATGRAIKVNRTVLPLQVRERTADRSHAGSLFATHSWYVPPPPPPPVAPPPRPAPEAPPFPYTFVGSYAPVGTNPVYFLSRADRVIDAHVGDRIDGVYEFESAASGNLVFNYLPLNIRQSLPTGVLP